MYQKGMLDENTARMKTEYEKKNRIKHNSNIASVENKHTIFNLVNKYEPIFNVVHRYEPIFNGVIYTNLWT